MPRSKMLTKKSKQRLKRFKKNAKRLAAYSAAAAATLATTGDRSATAEEVAYYDVDVTAGASPGILFNVITGATAVAPGSQGNSANGSFRLASFNVYPYIAGPANSTMAGFVGPGSFGLPDFYPDRLNFSDTVGPLKNFGAEIDEQPFGQFAYLSLNFTNNRGLVGLQFLITGSLHYGWAEVTYLGGGSTTLHAFGYNDEAGVASHPVPVPEPSSLMLCALGAAGLGMRRRRKKAA